MTVAGPVPAHALGLTLFHEHLHMDAGPLLDVHGYSARDEGPFDAAAAAEARWDPGSHGDNYRFTEVDLISREVAAFGALGGGCIVDQTPPALGRDPAALRSIAKASGAHVIMGMGQYLAPVHEPWVAQASDVELAHRLSLEARAGVDGVRPGIVGEIGTGDPVHPEELRVARAAASAAIESGLALSIHLHPWAKTGEQVLDVIFDGQLPPERVVLGHLNTAWDDPTYLDRLADRGVNLAFDLFGFDHSLLGLGRWPPSDREVAGRVAALVAAGHGDRLLISHDIGVRSRLRAYGSWGYSHIPRHVVPLLLELGCTDDDIERLLVTNPARLLTVEGLR